MQNRIKGLRKSLGLNQTEFGAKIGVATSAISGYELGTISPSNAIIKSICREYGVNETWLRTGAGEMKRPRTDAQELGELIKTRLIDEPDTFQAALVKLLLRLDPDGPELRRLRQFCEELLAETEKDPETKKDPEP
jgi:transcriptional regulator with XRE-family HTH domain